MIPAWSMAARKDRYETLTSGDGFHEFAKIPAAWESYKRCCFCRRGKYDNLKGLWEFGPAWVCTDCARDIVDEKMPVGWTG